MKNLLSKIRQYGANGISYVGGLSRVYAPPKLVAIELTNVCNFRCVYCPQSNQKEHFTTIGKGEMAFETFQNLVTVLQNSFSIKGISLTRDGEPFLHSDLEKIISFLSSRNLDVTLSSNGSLITKERARAVIAAGLKSMKGDFGTNKENFEKLRKNGRYERVYEGYRNILEAAKESNAHFHLVLVNLDTWGMTDPAQVDENMRSFKSLFRGHESRLTVIPAVMHNALGIAKETLSESKKDQKASYNLCHHPFFEMIIDWRGNVVACCRDLRSEYIVGNVFEVKNVYKQLWNGERMRHLRKILIQKRPEAVEICGRCDLPYGRSYLGSGKLDKIINVLFDRWIKK